MGTRFFNILDRFGITPTNAAIIGTTVGGAILLGCGANAMYAPAFEELTPDQNARLRSTGLHNAMKRLRVYKSICPGSYADALMCAVKMGTESSSETHVQAVRRMGRCKRGMKRHLKEISNRVKTFSGDASIHTDFDDIQDEIMNICDSLLSNQYSLF